MPDKYERLESLMTRLIDRHVRVTFRTGQVEDVQVIRVLTVHPNGLVEADRTDEARSPRRDHTERQVLSFNLNDIVRLVDMNFGRVLYDESNGFIFDDTDD